MDRKIFRPRLVVIDRDREDDWPAAARAAEIGHAAAKLACLRQRRAAAIARADRMLAADLERAIGDVAADCRALSETGAG